VTFSGSKSTDPQGQSLSYAWTFGDGTTGTGVSPTHTYGQVAGVASTQYTVGLTVMNTSGYSGQATTTATIQEAPALTDVAITGVVQTGLTPIVGAHVYLFAANTTGYGQASVSLLNATQTGSSDTVGAYVTTNSTGAFSLSGDYTCTAGQQLYIYALGGNLGTGANAAIGMLAALGACPAAGSAAIFAHVNEVTTVAAAYALAGYAVDATHVSSSGSALALTGIANAFANAGNLATLATGVALATTPAGNGTVPQGEIDTLANILATCVNPAISSANSCSVLFSNAESGGLTGTVPTDTATAAIYIVHNPEVNATSLYQIPSSAPPYAPVLSAAPVDFTLAISYSGGGLSGPYGLAIDAAGNAWVANFTGNSVTKLSNLGAVLSGTGGYTGGGLTAPYGVAVDAAGNAWVTNSGGATVTEISSTGSFVSGAGGYSATGLGQARGIAIDGAGNVWVASYSNNTVVKLTSSGAAAAGSPITGNGLNEPLGIAIDGAGGAWVSNYGGASVTALTSAGTAVTGSPFSGGGLLMPGDVAVDGGGYVWVANYGSSSVTRLSHTGAVLSGSGGYIGGGLDQPFGIAIDGSGDAWVGSQSPFNLSGISSTDVQISGPGGYPNGTLNKPVGVAIDGSGDIWIANDGNNTVSEMIGAATPVVTPIVAGLPAVATSGGKLGSQP
jgi:streptogramin lyase